MEHLEQATPIIVVEVDRRTIVFESLAFLGSTPVPQFETTEKHAPIRGNVCGWDNGKGRKRQRRNAACECGSGKKAKRCCVFQKDPKTATSD